MAMWCRISHNDWRRKLRATATLLGFVLSALIVLAGPSAHGDDPIKTVDELIAEADFLFWNSIHSSQRPEPYEAYLRQFPDGRFVPLAELRAKKLRKDAPTQAVAVSKIESAAMIIARSPERAKIDMLLWSSLNHLDANEFRAYLNAFPGGLFNVLAQDRLDALVVKPEEAPQ